MSLPGSELFGCQKSLVVVQAAVEFVGDETKIKCAWGLKGRVVFSNFLSVENMLFLFQLGHLFVFGNITFSLVKWGKKGH